MPLGKGRELAVLPACCDAWQIGQAAVFSRAPETIADSPLRAHLPRGGTGIIPGKTYACNMAITPITAAPAIE